MMLLLALLFSSSLVSAAPHKHQLQHRHAVPVTAIGNEQFTKRNNLGTLERMASDEAAKISKTCWAEKGGIPWPMASDVPNPVVDADIEQLSIFPKVTSKANTLTVHNYCSYDIYFKRVGGAETLEEGTLTAGQSIERDLQGTVMKASKSKTMERDLLIEYAPSSDGNLWYDLSFITCLGSTDGKPNSDASACPGHEAGLQLGSSSNKCFQCAADCWCDDQAYFYQENLCKKMSPIGIVKPSDGLTMEFCSSLKP